MMLVYDFIDKLSMSCHIISSQIASCRALSACIICMQPAEMECGVHADPTRPGHLDGALPQPPAAAAEAPQLSGGVLAAGQWRGQYRGRGRGGREQ